MTLEMRISGWMKGRFQQRDRYETDMHIDQLSRRYRSRGQWLVGGLQCLRTAIRLRDREKLPVTLALTFVLRERGHKTVKPGFLSTSGLERQLHQTTPPELHMLREWEVDVMRRILRGRRIELPIKSPPTDMCVFTEDYDRRDKVYLPVVWLLSSRVTLQPHAMFKPGGDLSVFK